MAPKIKTTLPAAPAPETSSPEERAAFINNLGLPTTVTDAEIRVILLANVGAALPFKPEVFPALVKYVKESAALSDDAARQFIADKFPMLAPSAEATEENTIPNNRPEFLTRMGLPLDTTDHELNVILNANEGNSLPLKKSVHTHLLRHVMRHQGKAEHEALAYLGKKFPSLTPDDAHRKTTEARAKTLREQLLDLYDLPADATDADIAEAAAESKDENIREKARRAQQEADEVKIAEKVAKGLTRDQAIGVIKRQREHDEQAAQASAARLPRLLEIIRSHNGNMRAARKELRTCLACMMAVNSTPPLRFLNPHRRHDTDFSQRLFDSQDVPNSTPTRNLFSAGLWTVVSPFHTTPA